MDVDAAVGTLLTVFETVHKLGSVIQHARTAGRPLNNAEAAAFRLALAGALDARRALDRPLSVPIPDGT